jgi:hypothetical protein
MLIAAELIRPRWRPRGGPSRRAVRWAAGPVAVVPPAAGPAVRRRPQADDPEQGRPVLDEAPRVAERTRGEGRWLYL